MVTGAYLEVCCVVYSCCMVCSVFVWDGLGGYSPIHKIDMKKKIVYIAHPIGGDVEANLKSIQEIYLLISRTRPDVIPFCPYYATVMSLDDSVPNDRELGMEHNKIFFERGIIDELWWFKRISSGVSKELSWCNEFNIPYYAKILYGGVVV